jgi:DNA-binding MarR family transcriptional regulator
MKIRNEPPLSRMICFLALEIQSITDQMLKPYNITMEQLWVLKCLSLNKAQLTQRELSTKSSKAPANITKIIDRLEKKSFVTRQTSSKDRRVCIVTITKRGKSLVQKTDAPLQEFSSRFNSGIDAKSWNATKQSLNIVYTNLRHMSKILKNTTCRRGAK